MNGFRIRIAGGLLALLAAAAVAAPGLGLRDPNAQPDGLVLRDLPPFSRAEAVRLADGSVRYAHEIRPLPGGGVRVRRGERWTELNVSELAGPAPGAWQVRPRFVLGTDGFGRDLLSRLVHGARVSLAVGTLGALVAVALGAAIGLLSGLGGRCVDAARVRLTDVTLSVPRLFLLLLLVSLYGRSLTITVLVLGGTTWMAAARVVRGEALSLRARDHVQAARASGAGASRIALLHVLPGVLAPLQVEAVLRVGDAILIEAALSFLGMGVPPPTPSWGNLIADGQRSLFASWWVATFPGLAIAATVLALHVFGDGLRERWFDRAGKRSVS